MTYLYVNEPTQGLNRGVNNNTIQILKGKDINNTVHCYLRIDIFQIHNDSYTYTKQTVSIKICTRSRRYFDYYLIKLVCMS